MAAKTPRRSPPRRKAKPGWKRGPAAPRRLGRLHGKVAVVTGASRGIGLAIAAALAAEGCDLVLSGRDAEALERSAPLLVEAGDIRAVVKRADVRDPAQVKELFKAVRQRFPRIDFLVNNAGRSHATLPVEELPAAAWRETLETNLHGMFYCTQAALPLLREGGSIVNLSSIAGPREAIPGSSAYSVSKAGVVAFGEVLREELRERRIRVITVIAGATDTEIWQQFWPDAPREKMMSPDTVASAIVNALTLPENAVVEEIVLTPIAGKL
jgi:NAD(P)-dependent dehydrogenase (short-subunit alcohol dehydrogenase family)